MKSNLKLFFSLLAVVIIFGSHWNCTIQIGEKPKTSEDSGASSSSSSPSSGCFNQMPTYTLGEPPSSPDEYMIVAKEFTPKKPGDFEHMIAEAHGVSADLRAKRVHNSVWPHKGKIYVTVGRFFTEKQALEKLPAIQARGYDEAYVVQLKALQPPKTECRDCPPPGGGVDVAGLFALMIIVVLVILGVASQTKKS